MNEEKCVWKKAYEYEKEKGELDRLKQCENCDGLDKLCNYYIIKKEDEKREINI